MAFSKVPLNKLSSRFGNRLQENVMMANYCTARVGGPADAMLIVQNSEELAEVARFLWDENIPFYLFGSGSNILVSDQGLNAVVIINRARSIKVDTHHETPTVWAESGANLGTVARQVALRGLSGLEWAATIPGSVGGAVYGNAGAFGGDVNQNLILANILHRTQGRVSWNNAQMEYTYRSSNLKRNPGQAVILSATFKLMPGNIDEIRQQMERNNAHRRQTQPPGASMGSMFKNPEGDFAGRLIEAAGLKGTRVGGAQVSEIHANFFVNDHKATANDIYQLISRVRKTVFEKFGTHLELEIELLGNWEENTGTGMGL